jgi:hypothetical protein
MNMTVMINGVPQNATTGNLSYPPVYCPDLMRLDNVGEADGLRGRVVRAFFHLMRLWPV